MENHANAQLAARRRYWKNDCRYSLIRVWHSIIDTVCGFCLCVRVDLCVGKELPHGRRARTDPAGYHTYHTDDSYRGAGGIMAHVALLEEALSSAPTPLIWDFSSRWLVHVYERQISIWSIAPKVVLRAPVPRIPTHIVGILCCPKDACELPGRYPPHNC
jgi:hypothetical protein